MPTKKKNGSAKKLKKPKKPPIKIPKDKRRHVSKMSKLQPLPNVNDEEWRLIEGSQTYVSNYGRFKWIQTWKTAKGLDRSQEWELQQHADKSDECDHYLRVTVQCANTSDNYRERSHTLACAAFFEKPNDGQEYVPDHIDGNKIHNFCGTKKNNYKDTNLEWVTVAENNRRAYVAASSTRQDRRTVSSVAPQLFNNRAIVRIEIGESGEPRKGYVYGNLVQAQNDTGVDKHQIGLNIHTLSKKPITCHKSLYAYVDIDDIHICVDDRISGRTYDKKTDGMGRLYLPDTIAEEMLYAYGIDDKTKCTNMYMSYTPIFNEEGHLLYVELRPSYREYKPIDSSEIVKNNNRLREEYSEEVENDECNEED